MEVTPNVHVVRVQMKPYLGAYSPNVYLVANGGQGIMIDSGFPNEESFRERLDYLKGLGENRLDYIVLTHHHFDHSGGAHRLREATGARIAMHPLEAQLLHEAAERVSAGESAEERRLRREAAKVTADLTVGDGDTLPAGSLTLRVVHTPGHSPGHICLFLEEERALFSGDNVLGIGTTAIAPPPSGDMAQYLDSLRRMKALDAALICPGHGPIVRQANRKIQELIDHRRERDEQVLLLIGRGKDRLSALVREIYPELSPHLERMARGQILSHLYKLQREGKVVMREEGDEVACRLQG
jgi:glyoxylase-like metal-dependent hydrolase (beta-lactamase superfamily II)